MARGSIYASVLCNCAVTQVFNWDNQLPGVYVLLSNLTSHKNATFTAPVCAHFPGSPGLRSLSTTQGHVHLGVTSFTSFTNMCPAQKALAPTASACSL